MTPAVNRSPAEHGQPSSPLTVTGAALPAERWQAALAGVGDHDLALELKRQVERQLRLADPRRPDDDWNRGQ